MELTLSDYSNDVIIINDDMNDYTISNQHNIDLNIAIQESLLHTKHNFNINDSNSDFDIYHAVESSLNDEIIRKEYMSNLTTLKPSYIRNFIPIPHEIAGKVVGEKFRHIIPLLEDCCDGNNMDNKVYFIKGTNILCIESHQDYLDKLTEKISLRIIDVQLHNDGSHMDMKLTKEISNNNKRNTPRTLESVEKYRHIFIDHSNIYIGAKSYYSENIHNIPHQHYHHSDSISINCKEFIQLLERRNIHQNISIIGMKHIIGSIMNLVEYNQWIKYGYTNPLKPTTNNSTNNNNKEVLIDDYLVSQIYKQVINQEKDNLIGSHTIVLVSGDGNNNNGNASMYDAINAAIMKGCRIEIWTWSKSCSYLYIILQNKYSDRMKINYLEKYYHQIITINNNNINNNHLNKNNKRKNDNINIQNENNNSTNIIHHINSINNNIYYTNNHNNSNCEITHNLKSNHVIQCILCQKETFINHIKIILPCQCNYCNECSKYLVNICLECNVNIENI